MQFDITRYTESNSQLKIHPKTLSIRIERRRYLDRAVESLLATDDSNKLQVIINNNDAWTAEGRYNYSI